MNNASETPVNFRVDTLQRLARLEELSKSSQRQKTFLENLQAYGGLIALIITIGYSWPLGVWDRFIINPQKAIEAKVDEIRESLTQATKLSVEVGRLQSSIANPELRDLATRSTVNQILLLITKYDSDYAEYRDKLFPEELLMIGIMYQNLYRIEASLRYFEYVAKDQRASEVIVLEANRQIAKSYFAPSPIRDISKARIIYKSILPKALQSQRIEIVSQGILTQSEWGFFEMTHGDWKCGIENINAAINRLRRIQPQINDQGNTLKLLTNKRKSLKIQSKQPQNGC